MLGVWIVFVRVIIGLPFHADRQLSILAINPPLPVIPVLLSLYVLE